MRVVFVFGTVLLLAGAGLMATEIPEYRVLETIGEDVELREYAPLIVAETDVTAAAYGAAGNQGFRVLADYIFGNNEARAEIAMTAPVEQARGPRSQEIAMTAPVEQARGGGGGWVVSFTMPAEWTMETLPKPRDERVRIRQVPARQVAAVRFTGTWSTKRFERYQAVLLEAVEAAALETVGETWSARYDPPWTPWFLRRNEIMIEVQPRAAVAPR
jgi:hypothetical protein